ncbi:MAG: hypothetical protein AB7W28_00175 [Armatimonadota bacterium]
MSVTQLLWAGTVLAIGIVLLVLGLRRLGGLSLRRRVALGGLRTVLVILAAGLAAGPVWVHRQVVHEPRPVLAAIDCSDSMDLPDMPDGKTRREALNQQLLSAGGVLDRLAVDREVEAYRFSDLLLPLAARTLSSGGSTTNFSVALSQLQAEAGRSGAGAILLLSDGVDTEGLTAPYAGRAARGLPPVFAVPLGGHVAMPNRVLLGLRCPRRVRVGDQVLVTVLASSPTEPSKEVAVQWQTSLGSAGTALAVVGADGTGRAEFRFSAAKPGRHRVAVALAPLAGEITQADNGQVALLDVLPAERSIVYLDGSPRPEMAALRRLLGSLKDVKVTLAVRKTPSVWSQELPVRRQLGDVATAQGFEAATAYILGNLPAEGLSAKARSVVARRVQAGEAAILVLGGPASARLPAEIQGLLPCNIGAYQSRAVFVAPPRSGPPLELNSSLWQGLPALAGANGLGGLRLGSRVAVTASDGAALVVLRDDAAMRSAVVATDTTYRWILSSAADQRSQAAHRDLWLKLAAWLLTPRPSRAITLFTDRLTALAGDPVRVTAEVRPDVETVSLDVLSNGQVVTNLTMASAGPGCKQARLPVLQPGQYVLRGEARDKGTRLGVDQLGIEIEATSREWRWTRPERALLEAVAAATGGRVVEWEQLESLPDLLPSEPQAVSKSRRIDPARGLGLGLLVTALLVADWLLRRRWGMI